MSSETVRGILVKCAVSGTFGMYWVRSEFVDDIDENGRARETIVVLRDVSHDIQALFRVGQSVVASGEKGKTRRGLDCIDAHTMRHA